ncbi:MAG: AAA family ATPase, partial [Planctomycetota bacterium]
MIKTLHITDPNNTPVKWWADVEGLQGIDRFDFTPGINILWGPNGIGKSTIILALARLTHCEQGGRSVVTSTSIRQLERGWGAREDFRKKELTSGMHIDFDGQPVVYRNPHNNVGLIGGMAGFDDDFYNEGLK